MLEQLKARRYLCSDEHINAFYNHIPRACNSQCGNCNYSWEIDATGYFLYGKSSISYFRFTDGMVFRLVRWFHVNDLNVLEDLNYISKSTNEFRIEKAITSDVVTYNGEEYLYYVTQRPNQEQGLTGLEELLITDKELFFKSFIDQLAILLPHLDAMTKQYGYGPSVTSIHMGSSRSRDSIGHYWRDIRLLKNPIDQFIAESKFKLAKTLDLFVKYPLTPIILEYADQKWKV